MHRCKHIYMQAGIISFPQVSFCAASSDWSKLVEFNRVNERGATVWNTAQVSMSLAGKNDHSLSSCSVLSLQGKSLR